MTFLRFAALCCLVMSQALASPAQTAVLERAAQLELKGDFKNASSGLTRALQEKKLSGDDRKSLEFEVDRLDRIKKDFPYTKDELFAALKKSVKDLTQKEFEQWVKEGRFDSREIDGKRFFMSASVSNLLFRYPELDKRRLPPKETAALERAVLKACQVIRKTAQSEKKPYVLPKQFQVTMTVTAKAAAAPTGEAIRAWLPIPRQYSFQNGFELISSSSPIKHIDSEQSPIRAVFLEQTARKGYPTEFQIVYNYTMQGVSFDIKAEKVKASDANDLNLKPFLQEAPHVVFTPEIRALSEKIVGGETNPYLKARKCYDWIADHIQYSYAIEYSTIRNISDYTRSKCYGDCGQEALLFITLCRLNGIPARWQSGWNTFPSAQTIHDWSEIYLEPYGWMPVDPYMGIYATQYIKNLAPDQKNEIRNFYFGGLDQYRMIANSEHNQTLTPAKNSVRSDNVDFQRGELEWGDHNIYFDQYNYELDWRELKPAKVD